MLLEGVFHKKTRHVIQDAEGKKVRKKTEFNIFWLLRLIPKIRFCVFHVEFGNACQRKYDAQGKEVEPNFGQTKLVNTGYLNSSYSR